MSEPSYEVIRLLQALHAEQHSRLPGNERLADIIFEGHGVAVVPQHIAVPVWQGMKLVTGLET